jgi:hypothetical protein
MAAALFGGWQQGHGARKLPVSECCLHWQRLHTSPQLPSFEIAAYDAASGVVPLATTMSSQTVMVRSVLM